MEQMGVLIHQLITMFLFMAVGFAMRKAGLITDQTSGALSNLLLYGILPCWVFLGRMNLDSVKAPVIWLVSLVRLIVIPAATILVFCLFVRVEPDCRLAILIAAVAPVGANLSIYTEKQRGDVGQATAMVCLSTLLSAVTMPMMLALASRIWG